MRCDAPIPLPSVPFPLSPLHSIYHPFYSFFRLSSTSSRRNIQSAKVVLTASWCPKLVDVGLIKGTFVLPVRYYFLFYLLSPLIRICFYLVSSIISTFLTYFVLSRNILFYLHYTYVFYSLISVLFCFIDY